MSVDGMIQAKGLTKFYGSRAAISELDFDAARGEILGFLGPNGAGKTTTMRILTGYMPPSSGNAEIGGFDVVEQSLEVRRLVGYLPETVPLYPDMAVADYLLYMAQLRKVKQAGAQVQRVLELVHMTDRASGLIGNLSKGMRQRVGLAQALIHQPEVLILDEPTIGLDPAQVVEVRNLITDIGKDHTVLLSTHNLAEAQQVCGRVLIINKGRIVAEDTPERLQARLAGAVRVTLRVRGEAIDVLPLVRDLPGIASAVVRSWDTLEFESAAGSDLRPDVARAVVNAGFDLLELQPASMTLEEIFLQLTRDEIPAPRSGDAAKTITAEEI